VYLLQYLVSLGELLYQIIIMKTIESRLVLVVTSTMQLLGGRS